MTFGQRALYVGYNRLLYRVLCHFFGTNTNFLPFTTTWAIGLGVTILNDNASVSQRRVGLYCKCMRGVTFDMSGFCVVLNGTTVYCTIGTIGGTCAINRIGSMVALFGLIG